MLFIFELCSETLAFLESVTCSEFNRNVIHIRYLLNKSYAVTFLTEHPPSDLLSLFTYFCAIYFPFIRPLVPWYISSNIPSKERYDVIDVNVTELARQMTLIESAKFNRIHRDEFLNGAWYAKVRVFVNVSTSSFQHCQSSYVRLIRRRRHRIS